MTDIGSVCGCRLPKLTKRGLVITLVVIGGDSRAARSQRQTQAATSLRRLHTLHRGGQGKRDLPLAGRGLLVGWIQHDSRVISLQLHLLDAPSGGN